jgi:hypothetical protein
MPKRWGLKPVCLPVSPHPQNFWWAGGASNPYSRRNEFLRLARLPITSPAHNFGARKRSRTATSEDTIFSELRGCHYTIRAHLKNFTVTTLPHLSFIFRRKRHSTSSILMLVAFVTAFTFIIFHNSPVKELESRLGFEPRNNRVAACRVEPDFANDSFGASHETRTRLPFGGGV